MAKRIKTEDIAETLKNILDDYCDEFQDEMLEITAKISADCATELRGEGSFDGTKYKSSWTFRPETVIHKVVAFTVYNEKHYRLTHLLEYGHEIKNEHGGPFGTTRAFPHIEKTEQKYIKEFETRLKEAAQK